MRFSGMRSTVCSTRVDLPMPGSPPISTREPCTRPPPSTRLMDQFLSDEAYLKQAGKAAGDYVNLNAGALEKIMKDIFF